MSTKPPALKVCPEPDENHPVNFTEDTAAKTTDDAAPDREQTIAPQNQEWQDQFLASLSELISERNFRTWFEGKTTYSINDVLITIGVGSPFLMNWMQKQFRQQVNLAAQAVFGPSAHSQFEVDASVSVTALQEKRQESKREQNSKSRETLPEGTEGVDTASATLNSSSENATASEEGQKEKAKQSRKSTSLGKSTEQPVRSDNKLKPPRGRHFADLKDYVGGPANGLALAAVQQVCATPDGTYNPLYLYGNVGTGKTHLLEGVYKAIRRKHPALQVVFLTAEAFANYFTGALRDHTLPSFRQRFRTVDVLLVDDVDFLNGKPATQEEFLHTFKQLGSYGKQLVVSSNVHPRLLSQLSEELTTRFMAGLVCRVETPDLESRLVILQRKSQTLPGLISESALTYVANRFKNNVRELEGAFNCLMTYAEMTGKTVSQRAARKVLVQLERDCLRIIRISDIEATVCRFFGVSEDDLKSSKRQKTISQPRMLAMFLARRHTQAAYSEIGRYFGGRNHSTVVSANKKIGKLLKEESSVKVASQEWMLEDLLETLEQELQAG